jgi:hypothetical protein
MSTRKKSDRHYFDCINAGCTGRVHYIGLDTSKNPVYECGSCDRKVGESVLEAASRARIMQD